jgi:hypothetical protein
MNMYSNWFRINAILTIIMNELCILSRVQVIAFSLYIECSLKQICWWQRLRGAVSLLGPFVKAKPTLFMTLKLGQ